MTPLNQMMKNFYWTFLIKEPIDPTSFQSEFTSKIEPVEGWLTRQESKTLFMLASQLEPASRLVEIGSYQGRSTLSIALALQGKQHLIAIDPHTGDISQVSRGEVVNTYEKLVSNLQNAQVLHLVEILCMKSEDAIHSYDGKTIDFLFIDGWHTYDAVCRDIDHWTKFLNKNGILVIDDWAQPGIKDAIRDRQTVLPEILGAVGKLLVLTNNSKVRKSSIGRFAKLQYPRLRIASSIRRLRR